MKALILSLTLLTALTGSASAQVQSIASSVTYYGYGDATVPERRPDNVIPADALSPIKGSLNYDGKQVVLQHAPAGSTFFHSFGRGDGRDVREVYRVNEDKTVSLVSRSVSNSR